MLIPSYIKIKPQNPKMFLPTAPLNSRKALDKYQTDKPDKLGTK